MVFGNFIHLWRGQREDSPPQSGRLNSKTARCGEWKRKADFKLGYITGTGEYGNVVSSWSLGVAHMKRKVGIVIEQNTMWLAKRKAAEEGRPLSDLVEDALVLYLRKQRPTSAERKMAFHIFCERPMKIPPSQVRYVLEEDVLDQ
jgi:hypothetical protein